MPREDTILDQLEEALGDLEFDAARLAAMLDEARAHEDWNESYVLCLCAEFGRVALVRLLLDDGASVEGDEEDGDFPLSVAIVEEDEEMVGLLLAAGADPNRVQWTEGQGGEEATPLALAAERDCFEIVKLLVQAGADPNCDGLRVEPLGEHPNDEHLPLHRAASPAMVDLLLELGARLNPKQPAVESALWNRRWDVANHLRKLGSEPTADGLQAALAGACANGHPEAVTELLAWGAPLPGKIEPWWSDEIKALLSS